MLHARICAIKLHKLISTKSFCLSQWHEFDLRRGKCFIRKGARNRVKVVCTNGNECASAGDVVVQLVLQVNEAGKALWSKRNVSQDRADDVRSDGLHLTVKFDIKN
jgi:hypothetical protein